MRLPANAFQQAKFAASPCLACLHACLCDQQAQNGPPSTQRIISSNPRPRSGLIEGLIDYQACNQPIQECKLSS